MHCPLYHSIARDYTSMTQEDAITNRQIAIAWYVHLGSRENAIQIFRSACCSSAACTLVCGHPINFLLGGDERDDILTFTARS